MWSKNSGESGNELMVDYRDTRIRHCCMGNEGCAPGVPYPCANDSCITMVECTRATTCAHLEGWIVFVEGYLVFNFCFWLLATSMVHGTKPPFKLDADQLLQCDFVHSTSEFIFNMLCTSVVW